MDTVVRQVVRLIASAAPPAGMSTTIVAVDGLGGAGKSTLAAAVGAELDATVIHTDDFASWDEPLQWWPRLLEQVLLPLSAGDTARYQRYDWDARRLAEWHEVPPGGLVLVEGVSSSRVAFRPYLAASIWVETPRQERLRRGLERDGVGAAAQWDAWMTEEDAWVATESPMLRADLVVPGSEQR